MTDPFPASLFPTKQACNRRFFHYRYIAKALGAGRRTKLQEAAEAVRIEAATTLQAHARGRTARLVFSWRRAWVYLQFDAASYVQACWRRTLARRKLKALRRKRAKEDEATAAASAKVRKKRYVRMGMDEKRATKRAKTSGGDD